MASFFVMLGPPGAGKGTQAKRLAQSRQLPHVSSGDIFRYHLQRETDLGEVARGYIDRGELVPDDVTIAMIEGRLALSDCRQGAILDGFPRTIPQVHGLDEILSDLGTELEAVFYIQVGEAELVRRLTGRLVCRAEGHIYHRQFNPPREPGRCDIDGSELYQREDDQEETVRNRIKVYLKQTAPLIEHYRERGLLVEVDGDQTVAAVTAELVAAAEEQG